MCMELMDTSMEHIFKKIYKVLKQSIPEEIIGKVVVAVSKYYVGVWLMGHIFVHLLGILWLDLTATFTILPL